MKPLMPIGDLMSFGFKTVKETWRPTLKYTVWFVLFPILYYVVTLGILFGFGPKSIGLTIGVSAVGLVVFVVGMIWASISLYQYLLEYSHGRSMSQWTPKTTALSLVPGLIWLFIIIAIPIYAAFGVSFVPLFLFEDRGYGFLSMSLLYISAILFTFWWAGLCSQAMFLLMEDDIRGIAAVKKSIEMVQGRWWAVFGRMFVPQIVFQLIVMAVIMTYILIGFLISMVLFGGFALSLASGSGEGLEGLRASNIGFGIVGLLFLFVYGLLGLALEIAGMISMVLFQGGVATKLFRSLKESK